MSESPIPSDKTKPIPWFAIPIAAVASTGLIGGGTYWLYSLNHQNFSAYGIPLFFVLPMFLGYICSWNLGIWGIPSVRQALLAGTFAYFLCVSGALVSRIEGAACLVMATPLTLPLTLAGSLIAKSLMRPKPGSYNGKALAIGLPLFPVAAIAGNLLESSPATFSESSYIVIKAPPEKVWPHLFQISNLPSPEEPMFKAGAAYPLGTRASGQTVGSDRECLLSTGVMKEKVTESVPNSKLTFQILTTPPSMKETNPFGEVKANHLNGYFVCRSGSFTLTPLPDGSTKLEGSSVYSLRIYPVAYWSLWTQSIVDQVHMRVMRQIKSLAEAE